MLSEAVQANALPKADSAPFLGEDEDIPEELPQVGGGVRGPHTGGGGGRGSSVLSAGDLDGRRVVAM